MAGGSGFKPPPRFFRRPPGTALGPEISDSWEWYVWSPWVVRKLGKIFQWSKHVSMQLGFEMLWCILFKSKLKGCRCKAFFCLFRLRPVKTNMNFRCTWWTPMCQFVRINAIPLHVWFPPLLGNPVLREWRVDIWSALERSYGSNAGAKAQIGKKITVNLQCQDVPILKWKLDMCQDLWKSKGH